MIETTVDTFITILSIITFLCLDSRSNSPIRTSKYCRFYEL